MTYQLVTESDVTVTGHQCKLIYSRVIGTFKFSFKILRSSRFVPLSYKLTKSREREPFQWEVLISFWRSNNPEVMCYSR